MAIATLALCYDNREVLRDVVKIRKGEALVRTSTVAVAVAADSLVKRRLSSKKRATLPARW